MVLFHQLSTFIMPPPLKKVGREKGHLFSGSWGALANILRDLGIKQRFREQKKNTFRELRKNKLGSWGEGSIFFRGAGSKDPPGRASLVCLCVR